MTKDMTQGSPTKLILGFWIPMLFGYLLQQVYGMVDTLIVGRFLGVEALAAVGATSSINFLVLGFCTGICSGFTIPIAHKFGAGDYHGLRKFVANSVWLGTVCAVVLTVSTVALCRLILELMNTPENIINQSHSYISVIFMGIPLVFLYNIVAGIIRSVGDSRTPVIFLTISSVLNIVLDIMFITTFHMGVAGAAWATVCSQAVSGILCLIYMKKFEILHLQKEEWKLNGQMIGTLCGMGIPMGLQYSITAIGSVVLQTAVNGLGVVAVAATTAAERLGGFCTGTVESLGATMSTYVGQNIGAGRMDRIKSGMKAGLKIGVVYSLLAFLFILCFGGPLGKIFVEAEDATLVAEILEKMKFFMRANGAFYLAVMLLVVLRFSIQGMGFPGFAILAGVFEMVARCLAGFVLIPLFGFTAAAFAHPLAWVAANIFLVPAFIHIYKKMDRMLGKAQD